MINYKHLYYFYVVAELGSISLASKKLNITPQTISGQISLLEARLEISLFEKSGRNLKISSSGKKVMEYASKIFSLGNELEERIRSVSLDDFLEFKVGVLDAIPKTIAYQLLSPAFNIEQPIKIRCQEGSAEELLLALASHKLDLVLMDTTLPKKPNIKGFSHELGQCGITFFAPPKLQEHLGGDFPHNLNNAPFLIQGRNSGIHKKITNWLDSNNIKANIIGEFDDTALMKAFGRGGKGVFAAPTPIAKEIESENNVIAIGHTDKIIENYYAITVEREIHHPAALAITDKAKQIFE